MEESHAKSAVPSGGSARKKRSMEIATILKECREAIQDFGLVELVKTAKAKKFSALNEIERELFCAGMIKLGEALTFCRDNRVSAIKNSRISFAARSLADIRSYFVHHHVYHQFHGSNTEINEKLEKVIFIDDLSARLTALEAEEKKENVKVLSKEIIDGENEFPFKYEVFIKCLQEEFRLLNQLMQKISPEQELSFQERVSLNNRVRNIFCIMVDMTNDDPGYSNVGRTREELKPKVKIFNEQFFSENKEFFDFFAKLKLRRNALCHLDFDLPKPYPENDAKQLVEFVEIRLRALEKKGYVNGLAEICLPKQKSSNPQLQTEKTLVVSGESGKEEKGMRTRTSPEESALPISAKQSEVLPDSLVYNQHNEGKGAEVRGGGVEEKVDEVVASKRTKTSSPSSSFSPGRK